MVVTKKYLRIRTFRFLLVFAACCAGILAGIWGLHTWITRSYGGHALQGGTFQNALKISFHDTTSQHHPIAVDHIRFKNMDPFLPITIHVQDSTGTKTLRVQADQVKIPGEKVEALTIDTATKNHSALIDDLSFQYRGRSYRIDFDTDPGGNPIKTHAQVLKSEFEDIIVHFQADNALPTAVTSKDLVAQIGQILSGFNGLVSTGIVVILLLVPVWMFVRFLMLKGNELCLEEFCPEEDARVIKAHPTRLFPSGKFQPRSQNYALEERSGLYKIFASLSAHTASDASRLVEYLVVAIHNHFNELEDRVSETFGMAGILVLSLGLLGTVVGMIEAFEVLEHTVKMGAGPAQIQLSMAHHISFALITTALGFSGRIFSILLVHLSKSTLIQNRHKMIALVEHFNPALNTPPGNPTLKIRSTP